ncbi:ribbon-helix-helix protein, CopG family [Iningainema tapete]
MARKSIHGVRKRNVMFTLTPEGTELLEAKANSLGISKSELIERIARNQVSSDSNRQLLGECFAN